MASTSTLATPGTPRRATSMPTTPTRSFAPRASGFGLSNAPLLPLSHPSSPSASRTVRSTARKLSYTIKSRASRYAIPLSISALLALGFLYYNYSHSHEVAWGGSWQNTNADKLHLYTREKHSAIHAQNPFDKDPNGDTNGLSLLTQDEEELLAEDDLYWQSYEEPIPATPAEQAAEAEMKAHRLDVQHHNKAHVLESLVWWLAEGGILPSGFKLPSKETMMKKGGRGLEKILEQVDNGPEEMGSFQEGWADYTQKQYRIVVFSKSYCPFSKRVKRILDTYSLTPAPFIIELDQRSDMEALQNLLQRITGRRTVPNVLIDFESVGGSDEISLLHGEGGLQRKFEELEMLPGYRRRYSPAKIAKPVAAVVPKDAEPGKAKQAGKEGDVRRPGAWAGRAEPEQKPAAKRAVDVVEEPVVETVIQPVGNSGEETKKENEELVKMQARLAELEALVAGQIDQISVETTENTAEVVETSPAQQPAVAIPLVDEKRQAAAR